MCPTMFAQCLKAWSPQFVTHKQVNSRWIKFGCELPPWNTRSKVEVKIDPRESLKRMRNFLADVQLAISGGPGSIVLGQPQPQVMFGPRQPQMMFGPPQPQMVFGPPPQPQMMFDQPQPQVQGDQKRFTASEVVVPSPTAASSDDAPASSPRASTSPSSKKHRSRSSVSPKASAPSAPSDEEEKRARLAELEQQLQQVDRALDSAKGGDSESQKEGAADGNECAQIGRAHV